MSFENVPRETVTPDWATNVFQAGTLAPQSIPHDTITQVTDLDVWTLGELTSSEADVFDVVTSGWYVVQTFMQWDVSGAGVRDSSLGLASPSAVAPSVGPMYVSHTAAQLRPNNGAMSSHGPVYVGAGGYILPHVRQTSGGALDLVYFELNVVRMS